MLDGVLRHVGAEYLDRGRRRSGLPDIPGSRNRHRIRFFASRAPGYPDSDRQVALAIPADLILNACCSRTPNATGVAKEPRDVNQNVLIKAIDLGGLLLEQPDVFLKRIELVQDQAALKTPFDRRLLVVGKTDPGRRSKDREQPRKLPSIPPISSGVLRTSKWTIGWDAMRTSSWAIATGANTRSTEPVATAARGMPSDLAVCGSLGNGDAPGALDFTHPDRAVAGGSREDDADRPVLGVLGQRTEKRVHRHVLRAVFRPGQQAQLALGDPHVHVGRDHVNVIDLHLHALGHLDDRHLAMGPQQLGKAFVLGPGAGR